MLKKVLLGIGAMAVIYGFLAVAEGAGFWFGWPGFVLGLAMLVFFVWASWPRGRRRY